MKEGDRVRLSPKADGTHKSFFNYGVVYTVEIHPETHVLCIFTDGRKVTHTSLNGTRRPQFVPASPIYLGGE